MELRPELHPLLTKSSECISEFSFANLFLFREAHKYLISQLREGVWVIAGSDEGRDFFMLPFGIPDKTILEELFTRFSHVKNATCGEAKILTDLGYKAEEDRDNFDYLYLREDLASLKGRRFHKKRNLVKLFSAEYSCEIFPLEKKYTKDALAVLDLWRSERDTSGDYAPAKEGLLLMEALELSGTIYYIDGKAVSYAQGEALPGCTQFAVHFEKGTNEYKGLRQFVNQNFAENLPASLKYINREQDLGDPGLRQAKESYKPCGFNKKYRVTRR
ncbi:MAG: phosphatidylglycerol lysyltransferase domain-containing protein [Thermodesulfobacteriota bacterium]